jgi:hypothetical protein
MSHTCHWIGCEREVPPSMWGCLEHWRQLPLRLRIKIVSRYRKGQEITKDPSEAYVEAAMEARRWILAQQKEG